MKKQLFFLMAIIFAIQGFTQGEITIGDGTSTTPYVPMHCNYDFSYTQTIYTPSEIMGGTISQIAYYMTSTTSRTEVIDIYAGNSAKTSFSSTTDYESLSNLTQVFSGSVTFVQGWNYITFTIPFLYNGTDNLIIAVDKNTDSYSSRSWQSHTTSFASCLYFYQDNTNIDPNSPTTTSSYNRGTNSERPNTKFVITPSDPGFCFAPTNLTYSDILSDGAKISWNRNVPLYSISYKTNDQTWDQAALISGITDTTYTFTNLLDNTLYNVKVTPECSSSLSATISFTTLCAVMSTPTLVEEFNSVPPSTCWEMKSGLLPASGPATLTSAPYGWRLNTYGTTSNASANIYSTNKYWLISPSIDLGNGTSPMQLEFDVFYTDYGNANPVESLGDDDRFAVVISTDDGTTWEATNAFIWSSDINSSRILGDITNTPTHVIIPLYNQTSLLPYIGTVKIGFYVESTVSNTDNDLHIDNFAISPYESCPKPSNVAVSSLTSTSANVSFQENGSATTWQYVISSTTNNPNEITPIPTTSNPILLTNLTPNTRYTIWIRSDCSTETSNWSNQLSFTTDALPATIPFLCNFENQLENSAWRNLSGSVNNWAIGQAAGNGSTTQNTSDNTSAYISNDEGLSYAMTNGNIYAYGYRDIDFGTTSASYSLTFDWKCQGHVSGTSVYSGLVVFLRDITEPLNPTGHPANVNDNLVLLSQSSDWQNNEITIDNISGIKRLIFYYYDQNYNYAPPAAIDNISVEIIPCPRPFNVAINSLSSTQAQIGWSSNVGNSWYLYYKSTFDPFYDSILVNTNTYTLQNLTPQATYTYYLRTKCGTELSDATNIFTFTTPCQEINTLPWNEGFEGIAATNELPPCWSATNLGSKTYTQISNYGSYNRNARTGTKSAYFSWSCNDKFTTPNFNLTAGQSYDFSFWYVTDGLSGWQSLKAGVSQVGNQASYQTIGTALTNITNTSYTLYRGSFTPNTTGLYEFSIECQANSTPYYLTIDDISLTLTPSCLMPTALLASNPTSTGFTLDWTNASGSLYNIQYMPATQTDWANATTVSGVTTKPYIFNTLNHSTSYKVRVQIDCGTEQSEWSAPITYTTECGTITEFPWNEGFESGFGCWNVTASGTAANSFWRILTSGTSPSCSPHGGTNMVQFNSYSYPNSSGTWTSMASPAINFSAGMQVSFWMYRYSNSSSYPNEGVALYINSTPDTAGGTLLGFTPGYKSTAGWELITYPIPTGISGVNYIILKAISQYGYNIHVDDIIIDYIPTCLKPTALQASTPTSTGFTLEWTDLSGSLYNIQYMPSNETEWANATTISGVTAHSYTFNSLNSGTIYKVRVQTDCGTKQSEWSAIITDTTLCATISTLPYTESFDNYGTGSTIYPLCWSRLYNATTANPYINSTNFSSPGSMYFTAATGKNSFAITPQFDASIPISSLSAKFQLRTGNGTSKIIVGVLTNPTDSLSFTAIDTLMPTASSTWQEFEVNFADYLGNGQYIAFKSEYNTTTNTCYIDDLTVYTTPSCERPIAISASSATNSITVNITPAETTDNGWKVYYREVNSENWDSINITSNVATISNLQPQTVYEIYAKTFCSDATYSFANNSIFVETKQVSVQTSYACDFEAQGDNGWIIRNGTSVNKWIIGTPVGARSNGLFISNNNTNASYAIGSYSVVIAEKLFEINSPDSLELSFDALIGGESTFDYLKVFLVDKDTMFSPSTAATYFSDNSYSEGVIMPNGTNNYINLVPATNFKVRFASPGIGVQNKLIFVWRNDGSGGTQPSCYIDNIKFLNIITPYPPTNLEANPSISTSQLTWTPGAAELGWQVRKGETGVPVYVTTPSYQANALTPSTEYTYYIRSYYADDTLYSPWVPVSFRTLAIPQRVTTLAATNINQTTSSLHATLVSGTDPITDQGFEYRVLGTTTWIPIPVILDDTINYNLIGLSAYTDYEYRAYASTDYVTIYGKSQFFKTLPAPPTTVTNPATNIKQTIVTLNGVVNQGSMPITQQGFEWRLAGENTWTTVLITSNQTAITYNLTGLTPITDYEYRTFVSTTSESVYGTIQNFTTLAIVPPTIITTAATSITQTIATINASIILGSEIITDQGFEWRLSGESTWTIIPSTLVSGTITNNLTGLVASTDYEYRAYATTESGTIYGSVESFTTLAIVPPILITGDAIAVAQTIEILNGSITFGSESITDQGFEWRELGETIWTPISVSLVNNNMIHNLTGLTANTDYEFRAYAITESATTYGSVIAFRTLAMDPPIVTTMPATLLSQTSATLNGSAIEVMAPILSQGFEWRELGEASWTTVSTTINNDNLAHILTGLTAYTEYEFRTYAITSEGTTYGAVQSFRTLPILPTVITNPATAITQIIATLNGSVAAGSETISLVGFEWRKQGVNTWTTVELTDYALVYNLSGIVASTNYEFRAFAITESGTTYGSIEIFTTLAIVPPIVVTNASTMVGQTVATINGTITAGSETVLSQGFEWKLASATAWTQISSTSVENVITHNLTGLTPNRHYEFRSFAVTESGTTYGSIETFTTLVIPQTVETNPATYITETNAILNSNISAGSELITAQGFEWRTASSSTWITVTTPIIGNTITYNLTGLTPYVDYEFRAYATTASGTIYGQINSFTTLAIPTIVETNTVTLVGQTQATLNGTITLGSKTVSSQGFEWKLASASNWTIVTKSLTGNSVSHNLTGLTANTAYEFRAFAINEDGTIYGAVQNFTTLLIPPTVATNTATLVAQTTATLNGQVTIGSEVILAQGFEIKLSSSSTWTPLTSTLNGSTMSLNVTGLSQNSAYQYRAYATTLSGTVYGTSQSFTTLAITPPTVVTNAASAITQTTAVLNGTITAGSSEITIQGFEWKLSSSSTWTALTSTLNGNVITNNLLGLSPNTAYQYRAYAVTPEGTVYGATQNFTTLAILPPNVVTNAASAITQYTATMNGTVTIGSELLTSQGFEYKLASNSTWIQLIINPSGNAITYNLSGLFPDTMYHYRAFATTASGTVYGTTQNIITLAIIPPAVVSNAATAITQTTATINGTITLGSETLTTQGFEWALANSSTWNIITESLNGNSITRNLTNLAPNTGYKFRAYAETPSGKVYGTTLNFTTLAIIPPTVLTQAATSITENSATINATVTQGTETIDYKGFVWRVANTNIWMPIIITDNTMSYILDSLTPNTNYEFRAVVITANGTYMGDIQSFTTLQIILPTVTTNPAEQITSTSAILSGNVVSGSETLISQGFEWKQAGDDEWTEVTSTLNGNTISYTIIGLTPNHSYRYRAYALTASGITYGNTEIYTTSSLNEAQGKEISINLYPNPASSQTQLVINDITGSVTISLIDVRGRILRTINSESIDGTLQYNIDLNGFAAGVYYVRINNSNIIRTQKLIVK